MMTNASIAWSIAAVLLTSACGNGKPDPVADLSGRKAQWLAARPARFVVQTCTHGILPPGCLRAAVKGGSVVALQERVYGYLGNDHGWEDVKPSRDPLEQMFDDALSPSHGCRVESVAYNNHYSFIDDYRTQCGADTGGRYVACFRVDETRIEACDALPEGAVPSSDGGAEDAGGA